MKKSKCSSWPLRASDSYVARKPSMTRTESSLKIGNTMAVLMPSILWSRKGFSPVMRRRVPKRRMKKPYTPCMQPMAVSRNKMMNSTSNSVRDALQPVRERRSANSMETSPVSSTAEEKNKNSRHPRRRRGGGTDSISGWFAIKFGVFVYGKGLAVNPKMVPRSGVFT